MTIEHWIYKTVLIKGTSHQLMNLIDFGRIRALLILMNKLGLN